MRRRALRCAARMLKTALLTLLIAALAAAPASAHEPTLKARSILPADATWPAPFPAAPNTEPAPAPGSVQPVGGFSALLKGPHGSYLAMPDNGFGSKANSHSFLLRVYAVDTDRKDARILGAISLHDPNHKIPFTLVNDATQERYLTGGDFDVESFRIDRRGTLWFGDEFGPFLLHTDLTGKVLEAPIPLPGVRSPDNPLPGPAPNLASSNGFEGMAISPDSRTLYPTLEGPLADDADKTIRRSFTFDIAKRRYEPGYRVYHVVDPTYLVSDLTALDSKRFVSLERDNFQGPAAVHKQAFVVTPRGDQLPKREVLDELNIADPRRISLRGPVRPGDFGLGDPFKMPYQTIEAVLPVGGDELAIVNDTNFGSTGRNPSLPDYSDFIRVRVPAIARS
jgi:hypothetical protein